MSYPIMEVVLATTRTCSGCGETKRLAEDFHNDKSNWAGKTYQCKECNNKRNRKSAREQRSTPEGRERINARHRAWMVEHRDRKRAYEAPRRATQEYKDNLAAYMATWRVDNAASVRAYQGLRRARKYGAEIYEPINVDVVMERGNWICGECELPIDPTLSYINPETGKPDPGYRTIGHIIDLSRGGAEAYFNVQPEHLGCNERKERERRAMETTIRAIFQSNHAASVRAFWTNYFETGEGPDGYLSGL